ncbi:MAG: nucleobase:cation symporter-2 family protein [Thiomonas sp.]|uniref:nucleobase:cation symporter-2 family protein n=1 Tax=Thiomonas sp. TaxID=2047785 RepID=UPI002A36715C|nr:nucleobase:cation symporter-2 family protein [Thiomonas sp.]MDY0330016.1 nucleobase:cation symporter-2 family protein [Thiomonas sp.]
MAQTLAPAAAESAPHSVDEVLSAGKLVALGIQHVLVMYAGAVAVPLIIGSALKLPVEQIALLITADLFICGVTSIIQSLGLTPWFGIRMPVMMGMTFASVTPMIAIATTPGMGLQDIFGAIIAAGVFGLLIVPFACRLMGMFPPVVTGSVITIIGISLMQVGIQWAVGGAWLKPMIPNPAPGVPAGSLMPNPAYASMENLGIALFVLVVILFISKFGRNFLKNISVLIGLVLGSVVAALLGLMHFDQVAKADAFHLVMPFQFGAPQFAIGPIVTLCVVELVVFVESAGMFFALGDIVGRKVGRAELGRGLRVDALGTILAGMFNTFPTTSFSQNIGLVGMTGVRSRWVTVTGGVIMLLLGLMPKLGALVAAIPQPVLGGTGIAMFGMVAATGIRILSEVDYKNNRNNLLIVALGIGFGMIPLVAPQFFIHFPEVLAPMLHSGILLTAVVAFLLNAYFNGFGKPDAKSLLDREHAAEDGAKLR